MRSSLLNIWKNHRIRHDFSRKLNFEYHIVDHCNLNCKYCSHYAPIAEPSFCDIEEYTKDLKRLSYIVPEEKIEKIRLLGGEPLLHPNIEDFLSIAYEIFPNVNRELVTNGILIKHMSEKFWNVCKKTGTRIYVSRYPIKLDYDDIVRILTNKGIKHIVGVVPKDFDKHCIRLKRSRSSIYNHLLCIESYGPYMQLNAGKLYKCSYAAYSRHLCKRFGVDISFYDQDYIDIYKISNIREIYSYLSRSIPFCSHCNPTKSTYMNKWDYSSFDILEWI